MPISNKEYFYYSIKDITITNIGDFILSQSSIAAGYTILEFVNYKGDTTITNLERIKANYFADEIEKYSIRTDYINFPIKYDTSVILPFNKINRSFLTTVSNNIIQSDQVTFLSKNLKELFNDIKYEKVNQSKVKSLGSIKEIYSHISVFLWSKSLSSKVIGDKIVYDDKIINITPFIYDLNTNVSNEGGTFSFSLSPTLAEFKNNKWQLNSKALFKHSNEYISQITTHDNDLKRSQLFFHNIINENDIVFIRFEKLQLENDRISELNTLDIEKSKIPNQIYDMIGLIDTNSVSSDFQNSDLTINISGRDLMKLLIEDGVYFYPLDSIKSSGGIFANMNEDDRLRRYNGQIKTRFQDSFKKLENQIKFIFNALSTVKICSDNLFSSYKENRSRRFILPPTPGGVETSSGATPEFCNGIWQIIELLVDKSAQNRIIADSSIGNEHGSLINGIRKICQEPFIEFYGDTYGNKYSFICRKPPYDQEGLLSLLEGRIINENNQLESSTPILIDIDDGDIESDTYTYGGQAYSWYRVRPHNSIPGSELSMELGLRAVFFKEYADIWGSKPLDLQTNYIPYFPIVSRDNIIGDRYVIKQGCYDLQFIVNSYCYLPFSKRGTIIISGGDRRIKKGILIRITSTGEIGLVESVQNTFSIQNEEIIRTTTITVDRILIEKYIKGQNEIINNKNIFVSYFNIIDTTINDQVFLQTEGYNKFYNETIGKWKVNVDVFNFFLEGRQFK